MQPKTSEKSEVFDFITCGSMKKTVYYSRVDWFIRIVFLLIFGFIGYELFVEGFSFIALLFLLIPLLFVIFIIQSIKYTIQDEILTVSAGFLIHEKIPVKQIKEIRKSNSILAAPAASLNRMNIIYSDSDSILISPTSENTFIEHLLSMNPTIVIDDKIHRV